MTTAEQLRVKKMIWALVMKAGGEIRLNCDQKYPLIDNWELIEYQDDETLETVLRARLVPEIIEA